ncbi:MULTISPECIES: NCS2 family permease [Arthrobacter]|uniref:NCS2 family permease n=1 Tax=Arthrobacter caoxuetaonis TaxID=2886935 RepID=A0A9X1MFJ1_9MICC|nr:MULTISPECIES: NCS2 family permease [Arthrobacter]MCC3281635.1 NCS2 family permease [Arthrobacter caoxuetaonis]MCC3298696.1 NCS2 family permease [Arthrobacter caoxuetaonis]MCC9194922.1 NCS2 family permease [Arthrobacter sp. zg-Y916]USQ57432.1 NCS2 family permease [Arthrobacter caoxuetaonis]
MLKQGSRLDRYFEISKRGSTVATEVRGGLATFFAMSYIVVLNPLILGGEDGSGRALGGPAIAAATALVAGVLTIVMGAWAKHPFAMATGLGVNAFVAATVATNENLTWPDVMGLVVLAGITMFILVLTGFRTAVFKAVPASLKTAIVAGIGLFIALLGFVNAGFVRRIPDVAGTTVPVELGAGGVLLGWPTFVFVFGLVLTIVLMARRTRGAILIGILASTVLAVIIEAVAPPGNQGAGVATGWSLVTPSMPEWAAPDLSLIGNFNLFGSFETLGVIGASLLAFVILLSIFFDAMGTMVGLSTEAGSIDKDGNIPNTERVLLVDAAGAIVGGGASVSSNQLFVESGAGIGEGARTGLASIVTGLLFLAAMFLTPLIYLVPFEAVAPALVVVGYLMVSQVAKIDWTDIGLALPSFLTIVLMPFTYSIANGLGAGFVSYVLIRIFQGRAKEIHPVMWVVSAAFVLFFCVGPIEAALGII